MISVTPVQGMQLNVTNEETDCINKLYYYCYPMESLCAQWWTWVKWRWLCFVLLWLHAKQPPQPRSNAGVCKLISEPHLVRSPSLYSSHARINQQSSFDMSSVSNEECTTWAWHKHKWDPCHQAHSEQLIKSSGNFPEVTEQQGR